MILKATAQNGHIFVEVIRAVFPGKLISCFAHITWPTHSPNLAIPDFFFSAYVKSKVHKTHPVELVN